MNDPVQCRLQTSADRDKQARQRRELMNSGTVRSSVIICALKDGGWHVLGQGMAVEDIGRALLAAAAGVAEANRRENAIALRPDGIGVTLNPGTSEKMGPRLTPAHRTAPDGTLIPPDGESFIRCGECESPGFFATNVEATGNHGRMICARCGNEIRLHRVLHAEGQV